MRVVSYELTLKRAILALIAGAIAGGLITMLTVLFVGNGIGVGISDFVQYPMDWLVLLFPLTAMWMMGVVGLGIPAWSLMHFNGFRQWQAFCIMGALLPGAIVALLVYKERASGVRVELDIELVIPSLIGMGVGWVLWRVAYRRLVGR